MDNFNNTTTAATIQKPDQGFADLLITHKVILIVVLLSGIKALIGSVGIFFNLNLVFITAKNKFLRRPCNILIAMNAAALAIFQISFLISMYVVASGVNLIFVKTCFYWQVIPAFMKYFSVSLMLMIGVDRLTCILVPMWHVSQYYKMYFFSLLFICIFISTYSMFISYQVMISNPNREVLCTVSDITTGWAATVVYWIIVILNFSAVAVYILFGLILKYVINNKLTVNVRHTQYIFKSLMIIVIIDFIGWGSNSAYILFIKTFDSLSGGHMESWCISTIYGYLFTLATTADAPVLYFCSTDYRKAFDEHFQIFRKLIYANLNQILPAKVVSNNQRTTEQHLH